MNNADGPDVVQRGVIQSGRQPFECSVREVPPQINAGQIAFGFQRRQLPRCFNRPACRGPWLAAGSRGNLVSPPLLFVQ